MNINESKLSSFTALVLLSFMLSATAVVVFNGCFPEIGQDRDKQTFIVYLSIYTSMWTLYFASKNGPELFRVSTLRRLLTLESKSWTNLNNEDDHKIEEVSMKKAETSITAIAMLVGVSFLGIIQAKYGLSSIDSAGVVYPSGHLIWMKFIYGGLAFFSSAALVCFILSVDALDCMFNEFKNSDLENKFRRYLYKSTISPKYFGFVCLLTSIVFLNAASDTWLGAVTIGIIISIGYRHWFPRPELVSNDWKEETGTPGFLYRFVPLVGIPFIAYFV